MNNNAPANTQNTKVFKYALLVTGLVGIVIAFVQALANIIKREQDRAEQIEAGDAPFAINFLTVVTLVGIINGLVFGLLMIMALMINPNRFKGFYNVLNLSSIVFSIGLVVFTALQVLLNLFTQKNGFQTLMLYGSMLLPLLAAGMVFMFILAMGGFGRVSDSLKQMTVNLGVYNKIYS